MASAAPEHPQTAGYGLRRDHGVFRAGAQIVPRLAAAAMVLALIGNLYPVPEGPYGKLPYIYLAYLAAGLGWFFWNARKENAA
jgi:hypothetical protein